jgi:hypothetical protein
MKAPVLLSVLFLVFINSFFNINPIEDTGYQIGDVVTDFELKNIDGNMVSLSDYKDAKGLSLLSLAIHVLMLFFMKTG